MSRHRIKSGAAIAITRFNLRTSALGMGLTRMGLSTGKHFAKQSITIDKTQLHVAQNAAKDATKEARLGKKSMKNSYLTRPEGQV